MNIEHRNVEKSCLNQVRVCNFSALELICVHDLFNSFEIWPKILGTYINILGTLCVERFFKQSS